MSLLLAAGLAAFTGIVADTAPARLDLRQVEVKIMQKYTD